MRQNQNLMYLFHMLYNQIYVIFRTYIAGDDDYNYKISVCQQNSVYDVAIQQRGKKWKKDKPWVIIGKYSNAHVTGGSKYWDLFVCTIKVWNSIYPRGGDPAVD